MLYLMSWEWMKYSMKGEGAAWSGFWRETGSLICLILYTQPAIKLFLLR